MRWLPVNMLALVALLASVYAQTTPPGTVDYSCLHSASQQINCDANLNPYYNSMTDVYNAQYSSLNPNYFNGNAYIYNAYDIPYYSHTVTSCDIDSLVSRPYRVFEEGPMVLSLGMKVNWADNVGYECTIPTGVPGQNTCYCVSETFDSICPGVCSLTPCTALEYDNGDNLEICQYGYWPPGPLCPSPQTAQSGTYGITLYPRQNNNTAGPLGCYLTLGPQGYFVNGVPIFNWHDGKTYNNSNVWHNSAYYFEFYDFDLCSGHAESTGIYHHHIYPNCLGEQLGDTGTEHSPVYGFAIDGFPIYGPWHAENQLSESCYIERNYYGTPDVLGGWGCGASGNRTCVLDNIMRPTTVTFLPSNEYGPTVHETVYSQSGTAILAKSGTYYEDYYYNETCDVLRPTHPYLLDRNNGHDHDDLGYHYHTTVDANGTAVFPYLIGPQFYGVLPLNYENNCCSSISAAASGNCHNTNSVGPSASNYNAQVSNIANSPATTTSACTSFTEFTCSSDMSAQYLSFCASSNAVPPLSHEDPSLAKGLETSLQVLAFLSFTFSALVVLTGILFPGNFSFSSPFNNILLMISISDMIGSLSIGFQFPANGTSLCTAQAVMYLYFVPACIVWTTLLVYQLRSMLIDGKLKISMRTTHLIGWSLPLIPLLLPLSDQNVIYGMDDQLSGNAPCSFRGNDLDKYVWFNVIFTIPILSCFLLMVAWYIETYLYFKRKGLLLFQKQNRELLKITLYPVILFITWLPNIVYFMIQLFSGDPHQRGSPDFITTAFLISTQYGTALAILFFIQSAKAREKWYSLFYRGKYLMEQFSDASVNGSVNGSVTFNEPMYREDSRKSEFTTDSEIVL